MKLMTNLSLGKKIGTIIITGISLISVIFIVSGSLSFHKGIKREFEERITALGENLSKVISGPLSVALSFGDELTPEMLETLKIPLESVVERKDIMYAVLLYNETPLISSNRFGDVDFRLPPGNNTGEMLLDKYLLRRTTIAGNKSLEIRITIGKEKEVLGEIAFGFSDLRIKKAIRKSVLQFIIIGILGIIILSSLIIMFVKESVTKPVQNLATISQAISQGDLSQEIAEVKSKDEIGQLSMAFRNMTSYIKEMAGMAGEISKGNFTIEAKAKSDKDILGNAFSKMVGNLKNLVAKISDSATQTADSSSNLAQISEQSTQTMSQLASAVSQISSAASQVAQSAQEAATSSSHADRLSKQGKETIEKLVQRMQGIQVSIEESARAMGDLRKRSVQIGEIVGVITNIADQTNLLSLNAAIEAARAGEAGRGFAVVADEVRKLAESSSNSAREIHKIIDEVQKDTERSVKLVRQGEKDVKEGGVLTNQTQKIFSEIAGSIENVARQIEQIAASAEETAASSQESSASSEEQTAAIEEVAVSASQLSTIAKSLQEAVQQFKV